jgi:hypothetical protein
MLPLAMNLFEGKTFYCPICSTYRQDSEFLRNAIPDEKVRWIANMITHYRHSHISSWNKCWGYHGGSYRSGWFGDYEQEKIKINNRAKRQIIRKATSFLIEHKITSAHFKELLNNDDKTIQLAIEKLDNTLNLV